jgi:linoleoyl-CoA desaturase
MLSAPAAAPRIKYHAKESLEFYPVLHKRIEDYFKNNGLSKFGDWRIRLKIILLFVLFFSSYFMMYLKGNTGGMILLYAIIFGFASIMIALNVMHDASHNALFREKKWNKLLLLSMNLLGSSGYLYHLNHVRIHHTFPNVMGIDPDLNQSNPLLRVSPGAPKYKFHKYQHLYALFIYMFYTLFLIFIKDFEDFRFIPKEDSPLLNVRHPRKEYFIFFASKFFYLIYALILPLTLLNIIWWKIILGYFFVNVIMSLLAIGVQVLIHTNDKAHFIETDERGIIHKNWAIHTLQNTSDLMAENRYLTFMLGGLNTHTIHHLFPGICHIHYYELTKILKSTSKEYGLEYTNLSLRESIRSHYIFLKKLGQV